MTYKDILLKGKGSNDPQRYDVGIKSLRVGMMGDEEPEIEECLNPVFGKYYRAEDIDQQRDVGVKRNAVNSEVGLLNAKLIKAEMEADIWQEKYVELSGGIACLMAKCDVSNN